MGVRRRSPSDASHNPLTCSKRRDHAHVRQSVSSSAMNQPEASNRIQVKTCRRKSTWRFNDRDQHVTLWHVAIRIYVLQGATLERTQLQNYQAREWPRPTKSKR